MGLSANRRTFRYQFRAVGGASPTRNGSVTVDEFTTTLMLPSGANAEPALANSASTFSLSFTPASRGRSTGSTARVVVLRFTGALPTGLVSDIRAVVVLTIARFQSYDVGQVGTYRGLPVVVTQKIDGNPSVTGGFGG